jgi:hypothetical protein
MRRNTAFNLVVLVCIAVAATPAFAGKGGSGGSGGGSAPSITIASVNGGPMAAASTPFSSTKVGDVLTFATTVSPLAGWEYPMVALTCYQDVNKDGKIDTSITGPDIVFSSLNPPSSSFTLGGYSSIWTLRGGGPAVCRADLDAYGWKGGQESIRVLATTGNSVTA